MVFFYVEVLQVKETSSKRSVTERESCLKRTSKNSYPV